jgi:hypothetical protein
MMMMEIGEKKQNKNVNMDNIQKMRYKIIMKKKKSYTKRTTTKSRFE